jgi:hypothetical protein
LSFIDAGVREQDQGLGNNKTAAFNIALAAAVAGGMAADLKIEALTPVSCPANGAVL